MAAPGERTFGDILRHFRLAAGLTQEDLAERATLSVRGISDLERDINRRPRPYTIDRLAAALALDAADRAVLLTAVPGRPNRTPTPPPSSDLPPPLPLFGRERERARLRDALDAARVGRGSLVLIGGEAGIGKTALVEALLHEAAGRGGRALTGRCYDRTETPPYGPWIELFGGYWQADDLPAPPGAFARRGTVGEVAGQAALFEEVGDFLAAIAARCPLVLLLDDLHWADPASLDLLRFLARAITALPVLLLVTYRADDVTRHHPLAPLLPLLVREAKAERLDLAPLDDDAVRALVEARYHLPEDDTARLVAYLQARAEGNPLFVGELLRSLEEAGILRGEGGDWLLGDLTATAVSALLRQVIDGRLARLGDESRRLLAVAAVVGHAVPLDVWGAVGEVDEDALLDLTERAEEAHLLVGTPDGAGVRFAHALIREALYEGVSSVRRRRLHQQVGEALAAGRSPDPDMVAMHFQRAGDRRAMAWLVRAGERAQLAYAWLTAIERYEAALALLEGDDGDLGERGWLRYRIARLRRLSTPTVGLAHLDEALRIAAVVGDRALAAAARYSRGSSHFHTGDYEMAIREMAAGCDALEALPPDEQERLDLGRDTDGVPTITNPRGLLVVALALSGRIAAAIAMGEATREGVLRHTPLGELGWAHHEARHAGLGIAYALTGRLAEAHAAFERARDILRAVGHYSPLGGVTILQLLHLSLPYRTERLDEHRRLTEEAEAAWARASASGVRDVRDTRGVRIPVLILTGHWSEARRGAEAAVRMGVDALIPMLGELARHQGELEAAWGHVRVTLPDGPRTVPGTHALWVALAMTRLGAALLLDAGDGEGAKEWLDALDRWLAWSGAALGQSEGQALWAQYHRQSGDMEQARQHAECALAHATEPRQPLALIAAHRLLGELDTDAGRHEDAATHLETSLALADACEAPYERALTLLAMAELRAAIGASDDAKRLLDEVQSICAPLGAKPALARADGLAASLTSG